MMDIDKNRADYVTHLELLVQNLQKQLAELKAEERWIPKLGSDLGITTGVARITLAFGGKNLTTTLSHSYLKSTDLTSAVTSTIHCLIDGLVADRLREVVQPEVLRLMSGLKAVDSAGKWGT